MKRISAALFRELCSQACRISTGWKVTRQDGAVYGFTSSDLEFVLDGVTYTPTNGFSPSAVVSKADLSVDNMEVQVLDSPVITEEDLMGGKWSNAAIQVFWVCPEHPEWGVVPLRGGRLGEIVIKTGQWTTQLRSLFQQMQQPLGVHFQIVCNAQLGDERCGVKLSAPTWAPSTLYSLGLLSDAKVGDIVQPTTPNDFWYVANYTTATEQPIRQPSKPGQGLSANDDAGPNDNTQVAVGPAPSDLSQFNYQGDPVDIFGIKL